MEDEERGDDKMASVFEHDATPTWSGFIYQGHVAVYLAVSKICELLNGGFDKQEIGATCQLEIENWEDVALMKRDNGSKRYISIHQVKNINKRSIKDYSIPIIQLMLERNYLYKQGLGKPNAYMHISEEVTENENDIKKIIQDWKQSVLDYYNNLEGLACKVIEPKDEDAFLQSVSQVIEKEPIKLNRKKYKDNLGEVGKHIKEKCKADKLQEDIKQLLEYLDKELAVSGIDGEIELYAYGDAKACYCDTGILFDWIVEKVKEYKILVGKQEDMIEKQYEYIADKMLQHVKKQISERHWRKRHNMECQSHISFQDMIKILDESVSDYETPANIMALRRLYAEALSQYCRLICGNACEGNEDHECKLLNQKYGRVNLGDEEFKKMCYAYNPDCGKEIKNRDCLNILVNKDGLQESVFEVYKNISEQFFISKDDTRIMVRDQTNNAFLTALAHGKKRVRVAVVDIVGGISNNPELVSPIFEADELITVHLDSDDETIWDKDFTVISKKYFTQQNIEVSDDNQNSICKPKKPKFVTAEDVISRLAKDH